MNRKRAWQWVEVSAIVVIWGLVTLALLKVVPLYDDVFNDFGGNAPAPTELLIQASSFMRSWWLTVVCAALTPLGVFQKKRLRRPSTEAEPEWERAAVGMLVALGILALMFIWVALEEPFRNPGVLGN